MSVPDQQRWARAQRFYDRLAPLVIAVVRLLVRVRVLGAERVPPRGPVLFAANHVAQIDPLVLAVVLYRLGRQVRFLAVSGLFSGPRGWILRRAGIIPVERGAGPEPMVRNACAALAAGQSLLVYPEGTIPEPGEVLPAKPGAGLLALRAAVPVVPVAIRGLEREPGRRLPRPRRRCVVVFGDPVDLSAWQDGDSRDTQAAAANAVLGTIRELHAAAPSPTDR